MEIASGIKLWSYGVGQDSAWSVLSTARHQTYIEIQGGPIGDQSIKLEMKPGETRWHVEYWYPSDKELNIYSLSLPSPALRAATQIPLFTWARMNDVQLWLDLQNSFKTKNSLPLAPTLIKNLWPPSGMERLDDPFKWVISKSSGPQQDLWRFYYGSWLAGRVRSDEAIKQLKQVNNSVGKVLLARLLKLKGDTLGAREAYESITESWLQMHPQVVVERDKLLRSLGKQTISEREKWLNELAELKDEWVIERRVQLLIDKGEYTAAKNLLLSTHFQKVHQTYTRTGLWMQICEKLQLPCDIIPPQLDEDRLARFGAYREYE
jgi:hypothetical protein